MPPIKPTQLWIEPGPTPSGVDPRSTEAAIAEIAQSVIEGPGIFVEAVAGIGDANSNISGLVHGHRWSGIIAECAAGQYKHLQNVYANSSIDVVNVAFGRGHDPKAFEAVSVALKGRSPDLVSLRLFGSEWNIWNTMPWRPKIIVVMFNPTFDVDVEFVQANEPGLNQGVSLLALWLLAESKGYCLVHIGRDAIFVEKASAGDLHPISREELRNAWGDRSWLSRLAIGFDGKMFLAGNRRLQWNRLPITIEIEEEDLQALPAQFRRLEW